MGIRIRSIGCGSIVCYYYVVLLLHGSIHNNGTCGIII